MRELKCKCIRLYHFQGKVKTYSKKTKPTNNIYTVCVEFVTS